MISFNSLWHGCLFFGHLYDQKVLVKGKLYLACGRCDDQIPVLAGQKLKVRKVKKAKVIALRSRRTGTLDA